MVNSIEIQGHNGNELTRARDTVSCSINSGAVLVFFSFPVPRKKEERLKKSEFCFVAAKRKKTDHKLIVLKKKKNKKLSKP